MAKKNSCSGYSVNLSVFDEMPLSNRPCHSFPFIKFLFLCIAAKFHFFYGFDSFPSGESIDWYEWIALERLTSGGTSLAHICFFSAQRLRWKRNSNRAAVFFVLFQRSRISTLEFGWTDCRCLCVVFSPRTIAISLENKWLFGGEWRPRWRAVM